MKRSYLFVLLLLIISVNGCRQQKQIGKRYYIIEMSPKETITKKDTFSTIDKYCEVNPIVIFPAFASKKIAIRKNTHEINYFKNHEWAIRPSKNLTSITVQFLNNYGVFNNASERYWKITPDYQLKTTIYQLQVVEKENRLKAHLNLEIKLIDAETDEIIIRHKADRYKPLEEKTINLFASAIGEMFSNALYNFSKKIVNELQ